MNIETFAGTTTSRALAPFQTVTKIEKSILGIYEERIER